jgi:DNA polymerase III epsilon subunit-like protein
LDGEDYFDGKHAVEVNTLLRGKTVWAHNAEFDGKVIDNAFAKVGKKRAFHIRCTLPYSFSSGDYRSLSQWSMAVLKTPQGIHSAYDDSLRLASIVKKALSNAEEKQSPKLHQQIAKSSFIANPKRKVTILNKRPKFKL